jgi:D-alanyl-D-alanine carboxypeptidase
VRNSTLAVGLLTIIGCSADPQNPIAIAAPDVGTTAADASGPYADAGVWAALDGEQCDRLDEQLANGVRDHNLVGASMGIAYATERRLWTGASGLSNVERSEPWTAERSSRIGSVTKTFTAALIFLLEEDGTLTLDDPLEQWVPGFYDGVGVTIRHMLANTSGIVSYNYVGSFDDSRAWTPNELVQWAVDQEPALRFEPGSQWEYSNTNYVLLGMVIEAASGESYADIVASRLTEPLGLRDTYVAVSGDDNPAIVDCYDADKTTNWTARSDPSFGWAAGAAVSTPADLARWAAALYGGDVLSDASLTRMVTPTVLTDGTTIETGLGAFVEIDGDQALYGHTGGFAGYLTYMYYWKTDGIALVVMSNTYETDLRDLSAYGWSVPLNFTHP